MLVRRQQGHILCLIHDPLRGHDVSDEDEDEDCADDVIGLYLSFLPQRTLEEG